MKNFSSIRQNKVAFSLSVIVAVFFVVSLVSAATTISTNIVTEGTLSVTGLSSLANASTTSNVSVAGNFMVNGYATTTGANGNIATLGTLTVGSSGTAVTQVIKGTCNLSTTVANLPLATSTKPFQCSVTGVVSGDLVFVILPSGGGSLGGTFPIRLDYAKASTTAGYIEVGLSHPVDNVLAAATSSFALATTSVPYFIIR